MSNSKWTRTRSLLFLAAMSVYPGSALSEAAENGANPAGLPTEVRLLEEPAPAVADAAAPAAIPAPIPVPVAAAAPGAGAPQVSVSDTGTVELHANEASLGEVLKMLSLQTQKNIVASKDVRGTVTASLYNVTLKEALDAILQSNGFAYREKGNFIYVYTARELADIVKAERQPETEIFRLNYTPAADVVNIIKPALSADAAVSFTAAAAAGIDDKATNGNSHSGEDMLIIRDFKDNLDRVRTIIKEVDRRPQQVLVEATIISARLTDNNALGVDFQVVGSVDFSGIVGAGVKNSNQLLSGTTINSGLTEEGVVGVGTGLTQGLPTNGLRVGVFGNQVALFVSALEEITDTAVLANPKVLTLNKQRGEVLVGREDGYITTTTTDTTTMQTVEFLKTGTRLIFRPFIGDDGYIRMEVHPEDSDGKVVGGFPSKVTTEVTTNVLVKDGHTVVIGGLFRESSATSRSQVPGLGNLPIVGALFRKQQDATAREEIIILLTPHIVKDEAAYSQASKEELKDMEKLRVGVRRGMMFFGRERLAESAYDAAVAEMNEPRPNRKKALWHLDCATNLNPKFLEAIKMKEQLTGREITSVDNSTSRDFVRQQIMLERSARPVEPAPISMALPQAAPATMPATEQVQAEAETVQADATAAAEPAPTDAAQAQVDAEPVQPEAREAQAQVETAPAEAEQEQAATEPAMPAEESLAETETEPLLEESETAVVELPEEMAAPEDAAGEEKSPSVIVTELPAD